ncbi:hypothetical protein RND71_033879 [Anisodus tanguticus]|uniref:Uncharacterized protein n=1 Tax=Anisodus tanguticus TaxID=243964 RepID=A0AAE1R8L0_9SOLA|nr:hypothetical protein RND71_033879 [Anisodus tanguticus]
MGFVELFMVALMPILKTLIITVVGLFLATEPVDLLGSIARHHLNNMFHACKHSYHIYYGSALGWILNKITIAPQSPQQHHSLVISCCAAGNLGSMLLIIIPAVCEGKNSPSGDSSTCSTNGQAYASLSMAIVGIIIGVVSLLRELMIGNEAPLHVIHSSAYLLGASYVGLKNSEIGMWVVKGVQVVRYVALPLCGIVVAKAARHFGLVGSDPLYHFVLLLQYELPSAMTIGTITQLFGVGESECSLIMLWNYSVASVALTLWTSYYMWFLS